MDYYLCSTVRHLLFSLLRSLKNTKKVSHIFMVTDQQNINSDNFDVACLPDNIKVHFIQRSQIRADLYCNIEGCILKVMALRNFSTTSKIRAHIHKRLFQDTLKLDLRFSDKNNLFVFNDRNKMSRLFRLVFPCYDLIEEGMANYYEIELKKIEKILQIFNFNKRTKRYFGDDKRCKNIYLLSPEKSASSAKHKTVKIDFINEQHINDYGYKFFKYRKQEDFSCIIATQPYDINGQDLIIYKKLQKAFNENKLQFAVKPHPREDISYYKNKFPDTAIIESKIPLELIIFGSKKKCHIVSICSSAGIGFEQYCKKINLIKDHELDISKEIIRSWGLKPKLIDERIEFVIEEIRG